MYCFHPPGLPDKPCGAMQIHGRNDQGGLVPALDRVRDLHR
jgi:hypothetical protein